MRQFDTRGSASLFGFLTATIVFAVSFAAVVQVSVETGDEAEDSEFENRAAEAASLAELIISDPGRGWYGVAPPCVNGVLNTAAFSPESLTRFGIGHERCAGTAAREGLANLSFDKMRNLRKAQHDENALDLAVDYLEARDSLQLGAAGLDFHLRSWPLLPDVASLMGQGYKDPNMRPLYIGNYTSTGGGGGPPPYTAGVVDASDRVTVYMDVENNGGTSTILDALFELDLKDAKVAFTLHTNVLGAGQRGNLSFVLLKTGDWQWKNNNQKRVEVEVHDKDTKLFDATIHMEGVTMTYGSNRVNVFAESEKLSTVLGGPSVQAKYYYQARDGKGNLVDFSDWTFELYDGANNLVQSDVLPTGKEGNVVHAFASVDGYAARLRNDALSADWNRDAVNVVGSEPGPYGGAANYAPATASVVPEMSYVDALVQNFDANVFSNTYHHASVTYAAGGDVYPDIRDALNDDLPLALRDASGNPTLEKYSTIFVGSNVDHNAMTSQAAKGTIKDWVYAGGTLVVFGSADQSVNWLQPIFHASLDSASGGVATPDHTHPSLHTPNDLDYQAYKFNNEWNYNSGSGEKFTHVVTSGQSGDVLGVSNAGVFGNGRVILSGWRPYDLTNDQATTCALPLQPGAPCQAAFLVHNLMTLTYADLYLDYGPEVPQQASQGAQGRIAFVYHPEMKKTIEVYVMVYVFG